ncbi:MAG: glycosyltransferase [Clostridia bacterium]|nr:glycosyltransferase [Clostridia bacterium]
MENNKERIKVGLFIDTWFPMVDGVIMVVDNYAKRLAKFCDVTVFTLKPVKKSDKTYPYKVVQCKSIKIGTLDYELPVPDLDSKFLKTLENSDLDIVHIHSPFAIGRLGVDYAYKHNIPAIVTMHSQYKKDFYTATKSKFLTKSILKEVMNTYNRCDEYYAVNQKIAQIYLDYGSLHLPKVQRNGTDFVPIKNTQEALNLVNKTYNLNPNENVFLFVGRINKIKNIFFLVDGLSKLKNRNFKMMFVGDGQDMEALKAHIHKKGLDENVILTGKIMDRELISAIYLRAKLFLFPSTYDASSLVQIEAASQKTPTLFIRGSATSSTVTEDVNGYMCEETPEKFAEKIEEILADEEKYNNVCENAFKDLYVSWDDCVSEMYAKYLYHINRHKRKAHLLNLISKKTKKVKSEK